MGRLKYGGDFECPIDDRPLAHLRLIVMNKMRRAEPFMLQVADPSGVGTRSLWVGPAVPLQLTFTGGRHPSINKHWLELLMTEANGPNGLTLGAEPEDTQTPDTSGSTPARP